MILYFRNDVVIIKDTSAFQNNFNYSSRECIIKRQDKLNTILKTFKIVR